MEKRSQGPGHLHIAIRHLWIWIVVVVGPACSAPPPEESATPGAEASTQTPSPPTPPRWKGVELAPYFEGVEGTFVLLDTGTDETLIHAPERAATRFLPASTYKVPHTLIALESGVVDGPDFTLEWDPEATPAEPWWPPAWAQDQTLTQAFRGSVVWYYQELARRIGHERMQEGLARFGYGNGDLSAGLDRFWLEGRFAISAEEQVSFLRRLLDGDFGLAEETTEAMKGLLLIEEGPGHRLSGKTGWVGFGDPTAPQLGWFVGYLESTQGTFIFALNLDIEAPSDAGHRMRIAREIFVSLELL